MEIRIGIRNETKSAKESRAPITPCLAKRLMHNSGLRFVAQLSDKRVFSNAEYEQCGVELADNLEHCNVIFGIKEIPLSEILHDKTYVFFSHTHKCQSENMQLLRTFVERRSTLIDYERICDMKGHRLVAFGYYAGLAGMINTLWTVGERYKQRGVEMPFTHLRQASYYKNMITARKELQTVGKIIETEGIPQNISPFTVGITGRGRVAKGAQEIMNMFPICEISPEELQKLEKSGNYSNKLIYKILFKESDIAAPIDASQQFDIKEYYKNGQNYHNTFEKYVPYLSVVVNGIYWESAMPRVITSDYLRQLFGAECLPKLMVVGDITCDPDGSIEFMHKVTDIDNPVFIYNPLTCESSIGLDGKGVAVMAVDILPSELPRDASNCFAELLEEFIMPIATADYSQPFTELDLPDSVKKAVIVLKGKLTPDYSYLVTEL